MMKKKLRLYRETLRFLDVSSRVAGAANTDACSTQCPTGPGPCGPITGLRGECHTAGEVTCEFGGPSEGCASGYTCGACLTLSGCGC